jgi:hypothetical protein
MYIIVNTLRKGENNKDNDNYNNGEAPPLPLQKLAVKPTLQRCKRLRLLSEWLILKIKALRLLSDWLIMKIKALRLLSDWLILKIKALRFFRNVASNSPTDTVSQPN